jgi:hypothetical protein
MEEGMTAILVQSAPLLTTTLGTLVDKPNTMNAVVDNGAVEIFPVNKQPAESQPQGQDEYLPGQGYSSGYSSDEDLDQLSVCSCFSEDLDQHRRKSNKSVRCRNCQQIGSVSTTVSHS